MHGCPLPPGPCSPLVARGGGVTSGPARDPRRLHRVITSSRLALSAPPAPFCQDSARPLHVFFLFFSCSAAGAPTGSRICTTVASSLCVPGEGAARHLASLRPLSKSEGVRAPRGPAQGPSPARGYQQHPRPACCWSGWRRSPDPGHTQPHHCHPSRQLVQGKRYDSSASGPSSYCALHKGPISSPHTEAQAGQLGLFPLNRLICYFYPGLDRGCLPPTTKGSHNKHP